MSALCVDLADIAGLFLVGVGVGLLLADVGRSR